MKTLLVEHKNIGGELECCGKDGEVTVYSNDWAYIYKAVTAKRGKAVRLVLVYIDRCYR